MKYLKVLILSLISLILIPGIGVKAAPIASPTSYSIASVTIYSPVLETGDQLAIIKWGISYTTLPTEDAGDTWLIRLKENGIEESSTTPYPFYNSGYATGVSAIYLPAAYAVTWGGNVSVTLEPNPTLTWVSIPAAVTFTAITWDLNTSTTESSEAIAAQVRALGLTLNVDWSASANPIVSPVNGILKLTDRGASYFDMVINILRTIAPELYQSFIQRPILVDNNHGTTYKDTVDNNLVGTPFDTSDAATDWGLSRLWATGAIWGGFCILCAGTVGYKMQTAKPIFFLFGALMIAGGFMGFGLLQSILFTVLGAASIILAFAWRGA